MAYEKVPADYCVLKIKSLPPSGGDTQWASGYEVYDRMSPSLRAYLDTLTSTFAKPRTLEALGKASDVDFSIPRGCPENVGDDFESVHPVIRTNPVTGWKSLYGIGHHCSHINEVSAIESSMLMKYFLQLITENHDLVVRFKWTKNAMAIVSVVVIIVHYLC